MGEGRLMFAGRGERLFLFLLVPAVLTDLGAAASLGQGGVKKPFTVADEIGLTHFYELGGGNGTVSFSPNGNYFAVWSERGRLGLNRVGDDCGHRAQSPGAATHVAVQLTSYPCLEDCRGQAC